MRALTWPQNYREWNQGVGVGIGLANQNEGAVYSGWADHASHPQTLES